MQHGLFTTSWKTLAEAVLTGIVMAVLVAFGSIVLGSNFNIFTADWLHIGVTCH